MGFGEVTFGFCQVRVNLEVLCHENLQFLRVVELSNNILLLNHLDFFDDNLEVNQRQVINMFQEHPEFSHRSSVYHLHELSYAHFLVALKALERHVAHRCEFLEDVLGVLVALVAP